MSSQCSPRAELASVLLGSQLQDNGYDCGMFFVLAAENWLQQKPGLSRNLIPVVRIEWMHNFAANIATKEQYHANE
jgi:Ulp1 family protease